MVGKVLIFREADCWKRSYHWYCLVSVSRSNYKFELIWVIMKTRVRLLKLSALRLITKDEMKRLTRSEDCSEIKIDSLYLSWTMMKWNFVGEVKEYYIDKSDLCSNTDNSVSIFFPSMGTLNSRK